MSRIITDGPDAQTVPPPAGLPHHSEFIDRDGLYDPVSHATALGIRVYVQDLKPGLFGCTDGIDQVWLDCWLLLSEARCTLAHEIVHIERTHTGRQSRATERLVDEEAARRCVTFDQLVDAWRWTRNVDELASTCRVASPTIRARMRVCDDKQRKLLRRIARELDLP